MKHNFEIKKFVWVEMFTDSNGRTSPGKFLAVIGGLVSIVVFGISCMFIIFTNLSAEANNVLSTITMQSVGLFTVCATLLGVRRFTKDKNPYTYENNINNNVTENYDKNNDDIFDSSNENFQEPFVSRADDEKINTNNFIDDVI